ncbi:hypothetical protein J3F83DRAFT_748744 [Trichoderma novae-zelandiae]
MMALLPAPLLPGMIISCQLPILSFLTCHFLLFPTPSSKHPNPQSPGPPIPIQEGRESYERQLLTANPICVPTYTHM